MDTVQIGMHGVIGQMQREEGARKTRRGLAGVVREGRSAGGKAYGYRPVLGKPGELQIVPDEAEVIKRIFSSHAVGIAPRSIASKLKCGRHRSATRITLERFYYQRQRQARSRHSSQPSIFRKANMESGPNGERPIYRQACIAAQSKIRVAHH